MKQEYVSQVDTTHTLVKISWKSEKPSSGTWKCLDDRDDNGQEEVHPSVDSKRWGRTEMIKDLRLMSYVNRPPRTSVLQGDRRVRKGN